MKEINKYNNLVDKRKKTANKGNEVKLSKHKSINEQVEILKDTLEEMMTGFDTEENRMDFILDICNGYRKRIS